MNMKYIILKQTKISKYKTDLWLELKKPRLDTEKQICYWGQKLIDLTTKHEFEYLPDQCS